MSCSTWIAGYQKFIIYISMLNLEYLNILNGILSTICIRFNATCWYKIPSRNHNVPCPFQMKPLTWSTTFRHNFLGFWTSLLRNLEWTTLSVLFCYSWCSIIAFWIHCVTFLLLGEVLPSFSGPLTNPPPLSLTPFCLLSKLLVVAVKLVPPWRFKE